MKLLFPVNLVRVDTMVSLDGEFLIIFLALFEASYC